MSDTKHTSGPWKPIEAEDHEVHGEILLECHDGGYIAAAFYAMEEGRACPKSLREAEANARLMAAAPDMLSALKLAHMHLHALLNSGKGNMTTALAASAAQRAIAKADHGSEIWAGMVAALKCVGPRRLMAPIAGCHWCGEPHPDPEKALIIDCPECVVMGATACDSCHEKLTGRAVHEKLVETEELCPALLVRNHDPVTCVYCKRGEC